MDIRFQATTKHGVSTFRIHTDSSVTLSKHSGQNKNGDDTWKPLGYYGSFGQAVRAAIQYGIRTFPGEIKEVLDATYSMEKSVINAVAELDSTFAKKHRALINDLTVEIDERLKVLGTEDRAGQRQPLERETEEESTAEESEGFELNF